MYPDDIVLESTRSLCPICLKILEAEVIARNGEVYLRKICPDHGPATARIWPDVEHYQWMTGFRLPATPPSVTKPAQNGCPCDCGLCANHQRKATLVEIEVTQRCNLRCPVCFMSAADAPPGPTLAELGETYHSILRQTSRHTSIQITGGEPTMRPDLPEIIRLGRAIGFSAIEINTNGIVIARNRDYLEQLADAGASGVYLQFDGLTPQVYQTIRGADILQEKLQAIENCRQVGLQVVLAMTVISQVNDDQMGAVLEFALQNNDVIAGLALQPAFTSGRFDVKNSRRLSMGDVIFAVAAQSKGLLQPYDFWPLGCSHPLCSSGVYLYHKDGQFQPISRLLSPQEYYQRFDPNSPQGSVFLDILAQRGETHPQGLSLVVMNYMDAMTIDLNRLQECSMEVANGRGDIIPFCAYQLTSLVGNHLKTTNEQPIEIHYRGACHV